MASAQRGPAADSRQVILGRDTESQAPVIVTTEQLCSGTYVLGVQGVGKSSLLEQLACQLMEQDESVIVFDPHGQLIDNIIKRMPAHRLRDTYHLDIKDREYPFTLNMFACANREKEEERDRTRNQVMHAFEKLWPETQRGVYFKKLLRHIIILLIEHPELTLADVQGLLRDGAYRERYTSRLRNTGSRRFWQYEYDPLTPAKQNTESAPLMARVDELVTEDVLRRILCQPQATVDIRSLIEGRKNLLVRLPINEEAYSKSAGLIGTMLMSLIYAATFSFANVPEHERPGFSLIVDEFQNFATDEYAKLFSQGRKFGVKQFLAHQYRGQLSDTASDANRDATLSAFTKIIFQVTEPDSRALGSLFVDLEERQQPINLAVDILDKLERHPNPNVKEFVTEYIWPLQAGVKDRIGTRRVFGWGYGKERREISFGLWSKLMSDGSIWPSTADAREAKRRAEHPSEGRDFTLALEYPERDFGEGTVRFIPEYAQKSLELLNRLLYITQKTGMPLDGIDRPEKTLTPSQYVHYREIRTTAMQLDLATAIMLRFDEFLTINHQKSGQEHDAFLQAVGNGQPPHLAEEFRRYARWRHNLNVLINALLREPVRQGSSEVRPADVAMSLQRLPLRQAYIRIGSQSHAMQTEPLAPGVDAEEESRRHAQLREQTRRDLCRQVSTSSRTREEAPATVTSQETRAEHVSTGAPTIRRSRPVP